MKQAEFSDWIVKTCFKESPEAMRVKLTRKESTKGTPIASTPGASIEFMLPTSPRLHRRYSLISAIDSDEPEFIVKDVKGGAASHFFHHQLKTGDTLQMRGVKSNLWRSEWKNKNETFICFGGGIGITPIYSLVQWGLSTEQSHLPSFVVYSGARSPRHGLLMNEFDAFKSHERFSMHRLFSERSNTEEDNLGRISKDQVLKWLSKEPSAQEAQYIISGPFGMMKSVHEALDELRIPGSQRHTEYFTDRLIASTNAGASPTDALQQLRPKCTVEIEQDSGVQSFTMHGEGKSILKAALEAGLDVPHSCRGGICLSCQAQVVEGEILRDGVSGLSDAEKEQGKILCCRTQPKTKTLRLRFDR
ncbi:MAG: 2Fe-2S iron-sulfur cluster binding domain-containing protein [Crocinitomicaceae bacterium]|jgi:ring-1,2-phenylacetyl-CoA epoxidase subunit PaaE|nr:2Fe-2S iron-sulfur cluster binding domain-containing protein [Crocinitomicaceae bacterium]